MATVCACKLAFILICVIYLTSAASASDLDFNSNFNGKELVEQGRTLVHHAVKRFMIILPAIFFKLGIAFTLLLVVVLGVINNSFIGFLLLVVGLSSVLARLQETRRTALSVPYISPLPPYHHHSVWDRSDSTNSNRNEETKSGVYTSYGGQNLQYSPGVNYYTKYAT